MSRLTISQLRKHWSSMRSALVRIQQRSQSPDFVAQLDSLLRSVALDKPLDQYIILEKAEFPAPKLIGLLLDLGITPDVIKARVLEDGLVNSRVLEGGFMIDANSEFTEDNMVQLIKVLLFKDYEGDSNS